MKYFKKIQEVDTYALSSSYSQVFFMWRSNSSSEVGLKIKPIMSAQACDRKKKTQTSFAMQV